jgi:hypothetical protein
VRDHGLAVSARLVILLLVVPALAACGAKVSRESTPTTFLPSKHTRMGCPSGVLYRSSSFAPIHEVLHAAQRLLAHETLNSQGTIYHLTPRNAPIDFLQHGLAYEGSANVVLNRATPGALTILRAGEAECGRQAAQASWAVHYQIPVSVIAGPGAFPFLVKTKAGWRFWGSWCGAGRSQAWRRQYCV